MIPGAPVFISALTPSGCALRFCSVAAGGGEQNAQQSIEIQVGRGGWGKLKILQFVWDKNFKIFVDF